MTSNRRFLRFVLVLAVFFVTVLPAFGQFGNTINGFVFGLDRKPIGDAPVELMDEFSRTINRTRTNASGRYSFARLSSGRFKIRTFAVTDYEDQEQEVEIQNIRREVGGTTVTTGIDNVQRDFYLRPRRNANSGRSEVVYAQEVPAEARELYLKGVNQLEAKDELQGLKNIKAAIESFPDYFEAIEKLGTEYIRLKHFEASEILLLRATQINARSFKSWYGLAYSLNAQNKIKPALSAISKALLLNNNSVEANFLGGAIERRSGNFAVSEKQLKRALAIAGDSAPAIHWQLALLYGNDLKRYSDAADELETYLKKSPDLKDKEPVRKLIAQFRAKALEGVKS